MRELKVSDKSEYLIDCAAKQMGLKFNQIIRRALGEYFINHNIIIEQPKKDDINKA